MLKLSTLRSRFDRAYDAYLENHMEPVNRLLHVVTLASMVCVALIALITGQPLLLAALLPLYIVPWAAHRWVEGRPPAFVQHLEKARSFRALARALLFMLAEQVFILRMAYASTRRGRARVALVLGRPRTCVPAALAFALGATFVDSTPTARWWVGVGFSAAGSFLANLVNTFTDSDEDAFNLPGRRALVEQIGKAEAKALMVTLALWLFLASVYLGWEVMVCMGIALLLVHQYSHRPLRAKARPWLGLFVFAQAVSTPYAVAALVQPDASFAHRLWREGPLASSSTAAFLGVGAFVFLWFLAKGVHKNVPDYDGDRAAGLRTSATVFATRTAASWFSLVVTATVFAALAVAIQQGWLSSRVWWALLWAPVATANAWRLTRPVTVAAANRVLRTDMTLSIGFLATVLLLQAPEAQHALLVLVCAVAVIATDTLGIDSRTDSDTRPTTIPAPGSASTTTASTITPSTTTRALHG